jgi:hypothetical protein
MEQHDQLISRHGNSRFYASIFVVLAAAFLGAAGLLFYALSLIGTPGFHFEGDIAAEKATAWGLVAIAAAVLLLGYLLLRSQPVLYLYDRTIRVVGKGIDRTDRYEDIEDLFYYVLNQFCYRASPEVPWIFADARRHRFRFLKRTLRERHAEQRGEKLLRLVMDGGTAVFRCLPENVAWSKSFIRNGRNMNFPMQSLAVTRDRITIGNKSLPVDRIADFRTNVWTESIRILDVDGGVFHQTHSTAIMSFGALYYVLTGLQAARGEAAGRMTA